MPRLSRDTRCFRVLVKGRNVFLKDVQTSSLERLGFYTTRYVTASNVAVAVAEATARVTEELAEVGISNDPSDSPILEADEVEEVARGRAEEVKGFTFFPDDIS